ncbi:MAG: secretion protein [Candidatus Altiarchaeales archaeon HGW-Altiarchaeales-3]|nr:MAG: secretion protein [Candidatus Altiarchaeales archaeon HGW-Altiarchaeales-3]
MPEIIDSYGIVHIIKIVDKPLLLYQVNLPEFSDAEREVLTGAEKFINKEIITESKKLITYDKRDNFLRKFLKEKITGQLEEARESTKNIDILTSLAISQFYGYDILGILLDDDKLEEVMVNGINVPAFVVHRTYGMCITNIGFDDDKTLNSVIQKIAKNVGREINEEYPLLDARLPDGSRVNVAMPPAAPGGTAITIRKFRQRPFSITELIKSGTITSELAAFLWVCVEGLGIRPINMIIAGGAGSGKTTTLNAIASFIPQQERVITVEDTLELNFKFLEDWIPLEATPSLLEKKSNITMDILVRNTLRMRPDRVIVGEVRGPEAISLLVAMDIGLNGSMGTLHANTARETTTRMTQNPMNVPLAMMPLIDLIIVQNRVYTKTGGIKRIITEVAEVGRMTHNLVELGEIYDWNSEENKLMRTQYPIMLKDTIANSAGISKQELNMELKEREKVLKYMVDANITENYEVLKIIWGYKNDFPGVMAEVQEYYMTIGFSNF